MSDTVRDRPGSSLDAYEDVAAASARRAADERLICRPGR